MKLIQNNLYVACFYFPDCKIVVLNFCHREPVVDVTVTQQYGVIFTNHVLFGKKWYKTKLKYKVAGKTWNHLYSFREKQWLFCLQNFYKQINILCFSDRKHLFMTE